MENPISGLSAIKKSDKDTRRKRRPLTDTELMALVNATRAASDSFRGLAGKDRAALYVLAANTGLRASELASLTPASFDFSDEPATVRVLGAYTKNHEQAVLPLRADVASVMRAWIGDRPSSGLLWPGTWILKASAKMIRRDLKAAKVEYVIDGRYADFHSLRHTYISNLARGGVHPRVAMELARHKKLELTMNVYTHVYNGDLAKARMVRPMRSERIVRPCSWPT